MDVDGWVYWLGAVILAVGGGIAWAWFFASADKRGDKLREHDEMAAGVHDTMYMQMANPAALPMRDRSFDKPKH
jgi:hypothetical protein